MEDLTACPIVLGFQTVQKSPWSVAATSVMMEWS